MQPIERRIARQLVRAILAEGAAISVWEGEDFAIQGSKDEAAIMQSLASTDSDRIIANKDGKQLGWFWLIYGNGEDLLSDMADNEWCSRVGCIDII